MRQRIRCRARDTGERMRISTSLTLNAQNQLRLTSNAIARSLERLSSGKRINHAKDDLGSFNMSTQLTAQVRGLRQGIQNVNTALGMVQTAEEGISSQIDIITRMRELAVSASNGTLTSADRENLNTEVTSLYNEYKRITTDTQFNGTAVLDGSYITKGVQLGANPTDQMLVGMQSTQAVSTFTKTIGSGMFQSRATHTAASSGVVRAVAVEDVNNDGIGDLVTVNHHNSEVSVSLGLGNGQFYAAKTFAIDNHGAAVDVADINNDGKLDIVAGSSIGTVSISLGNGDGTFQARTTKSVAPPADVKLADFDKDGNLDMLTSDGATTASLYLGDGSGGFGSATNVTVGSGGGRLVVGDLNGDGNLDFVSSDQIDGTISVVTGNGDGTFNSRVTYATGTSPLGLSLADLNGDGSLDIAIANSGSSSVSLKLNNGLGTFSAGTTLTSGGGPSDVQAGDLNKDGIQDLVVLDVTDSTASIFIGKASATFNSRSTFTIGNVSNMAALADLNGDDVLDFVTADEGDPTVSILLQKATTATGISDIDVSTQEKAQKLLDILDTALSSLQSKQADLAALHSRLDVSAASSLLLSDSLDEAKGKVEDIDYALEIADLVKNQILQQGQVAVLAQANLQMQTVLGLFENRA